VKLDAETGFVESVVMQSGEVVAGERGVEITG